jgi:hypothetical protein
MLGERTRRLSGFAEVAGPEARQLDKLAWSRRCAMLMGSACPWKLEHICLTSWSGQDALTILQSHLTTKVIDLAPTIVQATTGRRKSTCHDCCSGLIAIGSSVQSPAGLALESHLKSHGVCPLNRTCNGKMKDLTPICPRKPPGDTADQHEMG